MTRTVGSSHSPSKIYFIVRPVDANIPDLDGAQLISDQVGALSGEPADIKQAVKDPSFRPVEGMELMKSSPPTTTVGETITTSQSSSFSASFGFFGDTPTATVTAGKSFSDSKSISVPGVAVDARDWQEVMSFRFHTETRAFDNGSFAPSLTVYYTIPDDGSDAAGRTGSLAAGSPSICFEIITRITFEPIDLRNADQFDHWEAPANRWLFQVPAPPLPPVRK